MAAGPSPDPWGRRPWWPVWWGVGRVVYCIWICLGWGSRDPNSGACVLSLPPWVTTPWRGKSPYFKLRILGWDSAPILTSWAKSLRVDKLLSFTDLRFSHLQNEANNAYFYWVFGRTKLGKWIQERLVNYIKAAYGANCDEVCCRCSIQFKKQVLSITVYQACPVLCTSGVRMMNKNQPLGRGYNMSKVAAMGSFPCEFTSAVEMHCWQHVQSRIICCSDHKLFASQASIPHFFLVTALSHFHLRVYFSLSFCFE